jgi:hypothetical protein
MAKQKRSIAPQNQEKLPAGVSMSWLPAGYKLKSVLAGQLWQPKVDEVRLLEITGFVHKTGEFDGRPTEYDVLTAFDIQTGEEFVFIPGGLVQHLFKEGTIKTGSRLALKYLGQERLKKSGNMANKWEIGELA